MEKQINKYDLEERLILFAVSVIEIVEEMPNSRAANHLAGQLLRSGTSPALNYGEAQGSESRKDFIHKMKIALKELRETNVCLKIIYRTKNFKSKEKIEAALAETNELLSIFVKSVKTALKNNSKEQAYN
jgi:four helix bundle protein